MGLGFDKALVEIRKAAQTDAECRKEKKKCRNSCKNIYEISAR